MIIIIVGAVGWVLAGTFFGVWIGSRGLSDKIGAEIKNLLDKIDGKVN